MDHFDRARHNGEPGSFYVFDYDAGPRVHANVNDSIVKADLLLLRDDSCPECNRPVNVVYRNWAGEEKPKMHERVMKYLSESNWHKQHP